ncbi:MAG: ribonuclease P protein component [Polyangiaceae bacterium]|nr:ribonuclease P protein component [Polyangiaceae bacterium]
MCTPGQTYPKSSRIRRRSEFLHAQANSVRISTAHFTLLISANRRGEQCRLGVVASKKVGGAVQRNRAKRLVRETFRTHRELFPSGTDVVVIVKNGASNLCLDDVLGEVHRVSRLMARRAGEVLRK